MQTEKQLADLKEGESAYIKEINISGAMRRRLRDLGLITGTRVKCSFKSPCGDPVAYIIRGAVIALRSEDSRRISVK